MKTKNILEIGCGQGFNTYLLSKNENNKVVGVDLSDQNIKIANKRYKGVNFLVMDVSKLNFENEYFDSVYAMDILEHVDDLNSVLRECCRVLKQGGKFIINVPAEKSEAWLLKIRPTYFQEIHYVRIFNDKRNELENILQKFNFEVVKKIPRDFLHHIELYWLFTRKKKSSTQLGIGNWRDTKINMLIHIGLLFFDNDVFITPLKYIPIWIITLPIGTFINFFGNRVFPKSFYYEFVKIN
jgi:SAM-dependent methyltransferase